MREWGSRCERALARGAFFAAAGWGPSLPCGVRASLCLLASDFSGVTPMGWVSVGWGSFFDCSTP